MYYTRSTKQLDTVSTSKPKAENVISSQTDKAKKKLISSSGRVVLRVKNKSDHESLNKSGKNIQLSADRKIKTLPVCKTQSPCLRKNRHRDLNKNKNCVQTAVNKENVTGKEQTVVNKDCEYKKCNTDKIINNGTLTTKSKDINNKRLKIIYVAKENEDASRNKFFKSLHPNKKSIPQYMPVWKMCPNNNQESKKRTIDVYDIAEDNDLKKEGFNKKKKIVKPKKSKVKKSLIKAKNKVSKRYQDKVFNSKTKAVFKQDHTKLTCSTENNAVEKNTLQKSDTSFKNDKGNFKTPDEVTIIGQDKQIHRKVTSIKETDSGSKKTSNNDKIDLGKQFSREVTPVREIQPGLELTSSILKKEDFNAVEKVLIPQMTSTPESDVCCPTTTHAQLGSSYIARMSEIPAIPVIASNLEVDDSMIEELLYSSKPTCSPVEISLFEPLTEFHKIVQKPPESNIKQMKLNAFVGQSVTTAIVNVTERTKNTEKDLLTNSWNLSLSPVKKRNNLKSKNVGQKNIANKPRKSYENRDKIRVNIANWKKTCNKEKTATEKAEEELLKSMNEHFTQLESFELCVE